MHPIICGDTVCIIMMHLRPRHLFNFMLVNKHVYEKVKRNEEYYARLALYYEMCGCGIPCMPNIYKHMQNLPFGYNYAMNDFTKIAFGFLNDTWKCPVYNTKHALTEYARICKLCHPSEDVDWNEETEKQYEFYTEHPQADRMFASSEIDYNNVIEVLKKSVKDDNEMHAWNVFQIKFQKLSYWLDDDNDMTLQNKKDIAQSILNIFEKHLDDVEPENRHVDNWMLQMAVGWFKMHVNLRKEMENIPKRLYAWIEDVCTLPEFQTITWEKRKYICNYVQDLVLEAAKVEIPNPLENNVTHFKMGFVVSVGGRYNDLSLAVHNLYGNTYIQEGTD